MIMAMLFQCAGKQRHESGVESPFGEQPPEQIGEAEGGEEGVRRRAGAEQRRHQHVADEAEQAARQRQAADIEEVAQKR